MGSTLLMAGLLSVSIPIIIHLLHRQKTTPLRWGAMMFLKESALQMKRRKNIDQWLLLLLRMLVLAFLAWLLARPLFDFSKHGSAASKQPVDLAIVIDHSMSMGRHAGDHTLFEEAQGVVDKLTDPQNPILRNGCTVSVILAEHRPRKLTPVPLQVNNSASMTQLHADIHALKPGTTDCTIPEAIEAAREVVNHGPNLAKVVLVVSDEQKTNWSIGDFAAWQRAVGEDAANGLDKHVEIHSYPLAADQNSSNISVEGLTVSPNTVGINRPVQVTAKISNSGPKDVNAINIHFSVNGKEQGAVQTIPTLSSGQSATIRFDHTFTTAGSTHVRVWTDVVDALAADNEAVAAFHVWQSLPILVIDGQLTSNKDFKSSMFLDLAMQPVEIEQVKTALIQPKTVGVADSAGMNLNDYYAVVLNDVPQIPPQLQAKLGDYVSSGHGLWVILGARTSPKMLASLGRNEIDPDHILFSADLKQPTPHEEKGAPASVEIKEPNNPMVRIVASSQQNALNGAVAQKWWQLVPKDDSQVVLASTSGDPLILSRPFGSGQVVVWATSVDGNWNNWHIMPNFVPLVNETIYQLSAAQTRQHNSGNIETGGAIAWAGPPTPAVQSVDVTLPDGTVDGGRKANFRGGQYEFTYPNAFMPGLYQLRFTPTEIPQPVFYGVGIDHRELDPAKLSGDDMKWLDKGKFLSSDYSQIQPDQLEQVMTGVGEPSGFWWKLLAILLSWKTLAILVVASLFAETLMTYFMTGLQKNIDVAGAGLVPKV
jgi:hypothetical protein